MRGGVRRNRSRIGLIESRGDFAGRDVGECLHAARRHMAAGECLTEDTGVRMAMWSASLLFRGVRDSVRGARRRDMAVRKGQRRRGEEVNHRHNQQAGADCQRDRTRENHPPSYTTACTEFLADASRRLLRERRSHPMTVSRESG